MNEIPVASDVVPAGSPVFVLCADVLRTLLSILVHLREVVPLFPVSNDAIGATLGICLRELDRLALLLFELGFEEHIVSELLSKSHALFVAELTAVHLGPQVVSELICLLDSVCC